MSRSASGTARRGEEAGEERRRTDEMLATLPTPKKPRCKKARKKRLTRTCASLMSPSVLGSSAARLDSSWTQATRAAT